MKSVALPLALLVVVASGAAQELQKFGPPALGLPSEPLVVHTAQQNRIRVVVLSKELTHPWSMAFLPGGELLITERSGRLRIVRNGVLDPQPIGGMPVVHAQGYAGLMGIAVHPRFAQNRLIYLSYSKKGERGITPALARARFDGTTLTEVREIFVSDAWGGGIAAAALAFGPDGMLYMTVGGAISTTSSGKKAQDPNDHTGKVVRLRDDGSVPEDNPFVGRAGYRPEIYSLGHRNQLGLAFHPETGLLWASENGPQGGDEMNIILPGRNYGWPFVSYGREYTGQRVSEAPWKEGMEQPMISWVPSIAPSGITFYVGDKFPAWKGDLFVTSMRTGRILNTGHIERVGFNERGEEVRREFLLTELRQRMRDVKEGPDGLLYLITDEDKAGLLRIEPVD